MQLPLDLGGHIKQINLWDPQSPIFDNLIQPGSYEEGAAAAAEMIRGAANYSAYLIGFPKASQQTIGGRQYWQGRAALSARTYVLGISGRSSEPEGFSLQLKDLGTGRPIFKTPLHSTEITGQGVVDTEPGDRVHWLPRPHLLKPPSVIEVQITNLSASAAVIEVVLHIAQESFDTTTIAFPAEPAPKWGGMGLVVPSPYTLQNLRQSSTELAWPTNPAWAAGGSGGPFYDLSPFEREQPLNEYNRAIWEEWLAWDYAALMSLAGAGAQTSTGAKNGSGLEGNGSGGSGGSGGGLNTAGYGMQLFSQYAVNPIETMPDNGKEFHYQAPIPTPALGLSDVTVVEFYVPDGWIAVIKKVSNDYANNSFQEGSGDLIWRVDVDGVYPPGYENITTRLGSLQHPRCLAGAILAMSGQRVRYTVSVSATAGIPVGNTAYTICSFDGYFVPQYT